MFKYATIGASRCSNAVQAEATGVSMEQEHHIAFGPFRVDKTHGRLWRGADVIALRPRSLALLRYLLAHPGRLVTQALHEVFAFGHSKKHMIQPHLGRLEPTPFLKYRV